MVDHSSIAVVRPDQAAWEPDVNLARVARLIRLGDCGVGLKGKVAAIQARSADLERHLLEIGFVEGASVQILHEGPFGRDPIAVRVDDMRVALRREEAGAILIRVSGEDARD